MTSILIQLPDEAEQILQKLNQSGFEAFVVGGAVRDSILGRPVQDWDIATSATPAQMLGVFRDWRTIPTGIAHGTLTVMVNQKSFEVTTFREDGEYLDHRRPSDVYFITTLQGDLSRRDFTINAMAYHHGELIDPFHGLSDLQNGLICCVGNPKDRFQEDALRMLRAVRFASQLGFLVEPMTDQAIFFNAHLLANVSNERIQMELDKILLSENCFEGLNMLANTRLMRHIIPELEDTFGAIQNTPYHQYDVFTHTLHAVENAPQDRTIRLAALLHDIGKPDCCTVESTGITHFYGHAPVSAQKASVILERLRYDNQTIQDVVELIANHDLTVQPRFKFARRMLNRLGEVQFFRLLELHKADIRAQSEKSQYRLVDIAELKKITTIVLMLNECFSLKDLAVNGNDLIAIGYQPSKELGDALQFLLDAVINEEVLNEKDVLINFLKNHQNKQEV